MIEQLSSYKNKKIVVELVHGRLIAGTVSEVNKQNIRLKTDEGVCIVPISAIQLVWENLNRTLTDENMDYIKSELRNVHTSNSRMTCYASHVCAQSYLCIPPDYCTGTFACPGYYQPSGPSTPFPPPPPCQWWYTPQPPCQWWYTPTPPPGCPAYVCGGQQFIGFVPGGGGPGAPVAPGTPGAPGGPGVQRAQSINNNEDKKE